MRASVPHHVTADGSDASLAAATDTMNRAFNALARPAELSNVGGPWRPTTERAWLTAARTGPAGPAVMINTSIVSCRAVLSFYNGTAAK